MSVTKKTQQILLDLIQPQEKDQREETGKYMCPLFLVHNPQTPLFIKLQLPYSLVRLLLKKHQKIIAII